MAFTEFCCRNGGSNLNAGTLTGNSTEPGTAASFTYASGSWVAATGVFTVASGDPAADGVAVGDFASVYADGSTTTGFVGRVTARDATTITVSLTAKAGTAPTNGTNTRTLKVGGAWAGPSAAVAFPFNFVQNTLTNAGGDTPRVNFKNDATYSITAAMTASNAGPTRWEGYTTAYGDGGRATIDGGVAGVSFVLLTVSTANHDLAYLIFSNNGASGSAQALELSASENLLYSVVVHDIRGIGFNLANGVTAVECEAYACGQNNLAASAGFSLSGAGSSCIRCISHDNSGSNVSGFLIQSSVAGPMLLNCISDSNGSHGLNDSNTVSSLILGCDFYNNGGDGINLSNATAAAIIIENCNLIDNAGWGINGSGGGARHGRVTNCGFGSGTAANGSGTTTGLKTMVESGSVTYAANATPWNAPTTGDFTITLATAKGAGRGAFTQTQASYTGTTAAPDIGACQGDSTDSTPAATDTFVLSQRQPQQDSVVWEYG
jgi:hypothetical protein